MKKIIFFQFQILEQKNQFIFDLIFRKHLRTIKSVVFQTNKRSLKLSPKTFPFLDFQYSIYLQIGTSKQKKKFEMNKIFKFEKGKENFIYIK